MNRLLDDPSNFYSYSRLYASSVAAILAWGFRATTLDSFWYKDVSAMIEKVNLPSLPIYLYVFVVV
jgi:hypothetical protein